MAYHRALPSDKQVFVVAHSHEFEEGWRLGRIQSALLRKANLYIVPEHNRAWLLKSSTKTKAPFVVIHNRAIENFIPDATCRERVLEAFRQHAGSRECKRFFIYQGLFAEGRCLNELVKGFQMIDQTDIGLILLGSGVDKKYINDLAKLIKEDDRIVMMPRIPAPNHLFITQGCSWGVILYRPSSLNNIFCAPNKIFEYSFFRLGMILPGFPGLSNINERYMLGELCDPENPLSISTAMKRLINKDPTDFQRATKKFLAEMKSPLDAYKEVYSFIHSAQDSRNT
jgi:glycosyltransferase involved in cell wall biosynthesis